MAKTGDGGHAVGALFQAGKRACRLPNIMLGVEYQVGGPTQHFAVLARSQRGIEYQMAQQFGPMTVVHLMQQQGGANGGNDRRSGADHAAQKRGDMTRIALQ